MSEVNYSIWDAVLNLPQHIVRNYFGKPDRQIADVEVYYLDVAENVDGAAVLLYDDADISVRDYAVFSKQGVLLRKTDGMPLLPLQDWSEYKGKPLTDFYEKYGRPSLCLSSGIYTPGYLTENACILWLKTEIAQKEKDDQGLYYLISAIGTYSVLDVQQPLPDTAV